MSPNQSSFSLKNGIAVHADALDVALSHCQELLGKLENGKLTNACVCQIDIHDPRLADKKQSFQTHPCLD